MDWMDGIKEKEMEQGWDRDGMEYLRRGQGQGHVGNWKEVDTYLPYREHD